MPKCTTEVSRLKAVMERAGGRQVVLVEEEGAEGARARAPVRVCVCVCVCAREGERERGREEEKGGERW